MDKSYTVFHLHTMDSNLNGYMDSVTSYKDYIKLAKKQNMKAIGFSEHGNIYDWIKKKQDCEKAGLKYIHGIELYMSTEHEMNERGYHIGLYAKNENGVKELNTLASVATLKGEKDDKTDRHFYYNPRVSMKEVMNTSDNIIVTTACLASLLWKPEKIKNSLKKLNEIEEDINKIQEKEDTDTVENMMKKRNKLKKETEADYNNLDYLIEKRKIFLKWLSKNKHRCFLEIQYHDNEHQKRYNELLYEWSKEYNIPLIAGTDTHSSNDYKAECRTILQKAKDNFYGEEDSFDLTWKTYDELINEFKKQNVLPKKIYLQAIENTNKFANMIEDFSLDYSFKYPDLYENEDKAFQDMLVKKYKEKRRKNIITKKEKWKYDRDIKNEYLAFKKLGMLSFMTFMSEVTTWCWENDIPIGFGRGSVTGSTVAYILDITDVNPVKWNTVFSRFCNADRISLGDIDLDFAPEDREKVYKYIIERFTPAKTSYILAASTLQDRGVIDTLAEGLNYNDLELVAKIKDEFDEIFNKYSEIIYEEVNLEELIGEESDAKNINFDYHALYCRKIRNNKKVIKINNLKKDFEELKNDNKDLFYYFDGLKGTMVAKGNHPAGIIGSPITLPDNLGVFYKDGNKNMPVSQCSMKAVDSLNYVKFDILGLKTVGIMKDTYKYIKSNYLKSHEMDWNDNNVWDNMITSKTGVFQFEGDFAFSLLEEFKPRHINDMSLCNASLRPSGKSYRERLIAREFNDNPSNEINELLKNNNGFLVYQEDTIKFLQNVCDFSGSEADTLRRAIGKKQFDVIEENLPKIIKGYCKHSSKPENTATEEVKQFIQIISDSSEYQFGYNHSTAYSMNGYACTRLRNYYPLEFLTAYLNRAGKIKHRLLGVELAKQLNIQIKPIRFRKSRADYSFNKSENTIYKGIESIKYCNSQIAEELYRLKDNEYKNFFEILIDVKKKTSVDNRQLKILTGLNFFEEFGNNKKLLQLIDLFKNLYNRKQFNKGNIEKLNINEEILRKYSKGRTVKLYKELNTLGYLKEVSESIPNKPLSIKEQVKFEMDYLGYAVYQNPNISSDKFYIVIEYKTYKDKRKPYVTLRRIKDGRNFKTKVKNPQFFNENPFQLYDVLKVDRFMIQKKVKMIGGKWQKTNEDEEVLMKWEVF